MDKAQRIYSSVDVRKEFHNSLLIEQSDDFHDGIP